MSCSHLDNHVSVENVTNALAKILVLRKTGGIDADCRYAAICLHCSKLVNLKSNSNVDSGSVQLKLCTKSSHYLFMRLHSPYELYCGTCCDFQYSVHLDEIMAKLAPSFSNKQYVVNDVALSNCNISTIDNPSLELNGKFPDSVSSLSSLSGMDHNSLPPAELAHYSALRELTRSHALVTHGFYNMGSTCFLSSVVQSLLHNPLLQMHFIRRKSVYYKCPRCNTEWTTTSSSSSSSSSAPKSSGNGQGTVPCIACNMRRLYGMNDMYNQVKYVNIVGSTEVTKGKNGSGGAGGGASKGPRYATVPSDLLFGIWKHCNYMVGYAQQDAHEFMIALLDSWENQVEPLGPVQIVSDVAPGSPSGSRKRNVAGSPAPGTGEVKLEAGGASASVSEGAPAAPANILKACFDGTMCSTLTCGSCSHRSVKLEQFVDLSLSLQQRQSKRNTGEVLHIEENSTLMQCLREYHSVERLVDPVLCSHCDKKMVDEKQLSISSPPRTLVIQLKRFNALLQKKVGSIWRVACHGGMTAV